MENAEYRIPCKRIIKQNLSSCIRNNFLEDNSCCVLPVISKEFSEKVSSTVYDNIIGNNLIG